MVEEQNTNMEHWWNDDDRGKAKLSEENLHSENSSITNPNRTGGRSNIEVGWLSIGNVLKGVRLAQRTGIIFYGEVAMT